MRYPETLKRDPGIAVLGCWLAAILLFGLPAAVQAEESQENRRVGSLVCSSVDPVYAKLSISKYFQGLATRSRVIQICVVAMCLALFIIMKKWVEEEGDPHRDLRSLKVEKQRREPHQDEQP